MSKRYGIGLLALLIGFSLCVGPAAAEEEFKLDISTIPAGFASYTIGVALAELINKNSTWLKATALEGRGPAEHMKTLIKKPKKRANYLFFNTTWDIWEANKGWGTYQKFPFDYNEFKFVFYMGMAGNSMCTLSPKIKTLKDLEGKKVCFDSAPGKGRAMTYNAILEAAGVDPKKLKPQYAAGKAMSDRLRDGLIDVGYTGAITVKPPNIQKLSPFTAELVATKDTYFISFPKKVVDDYKAKAGHPVVYLELPAKMYGPKQEQPLGVLGKPLGFSAHKDMPDKVITEILRITRANAAKFAEYTPLARGITKDSLASMGIPASGYHKAAAAFFKANGVEIK